MMTPSRRRRSPAGAGLLLALAALAAGPAAAQGLGQNFTGLQVSGDQPIAIESDSLDVDDANAVATFVGNVRVAQGDTQLDSDRLVVHYAKPGGGEGGEAKPGPAAAMTGGGSQIESLEAQGNVRVRSADQNATADTASFDMATQVVVMNGNVVLTQGENTAEGCRLTIQMETGRARLESSSCAGAAAGAPGAGGRVRMVLTPGSQPAASN